MLLIWGVFFVLCIIAEAATMSLVAIWFMPGALLALLLDLLHIPVWVQVPVFLLVSVALLVFTRRWSAALLGRKPEPTNADRAVGKEGIVTETVSSSAQTGQVRVLGQIWTARSDDDDTVIPAGTEVTVLRIEGVRLIVSPIPKAE